MRWLLLLWLGVAQAGVPTDAGTTLAGDDVTFAGLVGSGTAVVLISFERDQTEDMLAAFPALERLASGSTRYAVAPVLPRGIRAMGGLIDRGIRKRVPVASRQARTATFYLDKEAFRAALGIAHEDELALLIVRDGAVVWRGEGPVTPGREAEVAAALATPTATE